MIKPTVGRVVLYWPRDFERAHPHNQPFCAHITHVWNDGMVNLTVARESGETFGKTSVTLAQDRDAQDGECGWMPYQIGQALKAEAKTLFPPIDLPLVAASDIDEHTTWVNNAVPCLDAARGSDFGYALGYIRAGYRATRQGWNGKGMWLELQKPDTNSKMSLPYIYLNYPTDGGPNSGARVPWLASQTDMLATDWVAVRD